MKKIHLTFLLILSFSCCFAQEFTNSYLQFRISVENISYNQLEELNPRPYQKYYNGSTQSPNLNDVMYLDSIIDRYELTADELSVLEVNQFMVTERLSFENFGQAYHDVYYNDFPVFVSSDLIFHALHVSYDLMLKTFERNLMSSNLEIVLESLYNNLPNIYAKYGDTLTENVKDVDLYVTTAYSLIKATKFPYRYANPIVVDQIWNSLNSLTSANVPLFTIGNRTRKIDFSQFKVRGHYVYEEMDEMMGSKSLEPYFKTMMWLGRIDFMLTAPPSNPWEPDWTFEEIQHMNLSAFLLNELIRENEQKELFQVNEKIINYLVGTSDNITMDEYETLTHELAISNATQLLDTSIYANYMFALQNNKAFEQKIMGGVFLVDPNAEVPGKLPISYRTSGQRFIIDSEILSNVVFDRIIFQKEKQKRLMPSPLDALYCLGNPDAATFLQSEIETYQYGQNLASMRYLVESKESTFWTESLYNAWLAGIRTLNPTINTENAPFFMQTGAWHQQKMNTQLASYTQLRHDNLLYAKPSYTGGTGCSFPIGYVEPYPEFYRAIASFATNAGAFLNTIETNDWELLMAKQYFPRLAEILLDLANLAEKELNNQAFNESEETWLRKFLFESMMSGEPPYSGWISELFLAPFDIIKNDFVVVDLHTQPTDSMGSEVGRVLHSGTGLINQGVFIINQPGCLQPVAYVGAFMSYYENITNNYVRLTDQDWEQQVVDKSLPNRPSWVNSYLLNAAGQKNETKIELPTTLLIKSESVFLTNHTDQIEIYPNPVQNKIYFDFGTHAAQIDEIQLLDSAGKLVLSASNIGDSSIDVANLKAGIYLVKLTSNGTTHYQKLMKE